ncbi:MAG: flavin reductase family protein [Candidatus Heimdallarchaeota archaeon]|nr:flavin reductase family protein [Candidatus Heimdallarchaeota archaeon]MBY8993637.1 flavin reductase family protein [Candidatus Heimdallarchaeota archaeon]
MENEEHNRIKRIELSESGPMLLPVPAIILGVKGDEKTKDDLTCVWTFVLEGTPPQVGISVGKKSAISGHYQVALELIEKHGEFTLNVPDASWVEAFDIIDMCASERDDKFARAGLTRVQSKLIDAPGIAEAPIILECRVISSHELLPKRTVFFAEVLRTSVHPGVTDSNGRLIPESKPFFGMLAGCGEFWTFKEKVGQIGQTKKIDHIRY